MTTTASTISGPRSSEARNREGDCRRLRLAELRAVPQTWGWGDDRDCLPPEGVRRSWACLQTVTIGVTLLRVPQRQHQRFIGPILGCVGSSRQLHIPVTQPLGPPPSQLLKSSPGTGRQDWSWACEGYDTTKKKNKKHHQQALHPEVWVRILVWLLQIS